MQKLTQAEYLPTHKLKLFDRHKRFHTYIKAGIEMIPAFIYSMARNEALATIVDINLPREKLFTSELAFAYGFDNASGIEADRF